MREVAGQGVEESIVCGSCSFCLCRVCVDSCAGACGTGSD